MRMDWQCKIRGDGGRNEAIEEIYVRKKQNEERNEGEILVLIFFGVNHFCKLTDEVNKQKEKKQMNSEGKK